MLLDDIGDLKPENLLFESTANDAILKLSDFGFAKEGKKKQNKLTIDHLFFQGHNEEQPLKTPW